jgi:hypothetical protein
MAPDPESIHESLAQCAHAKFKNFNFQICVDLPQLPLNEPCLINEDYPGFCARGTNDSFPRCG